MDEPVAHIEAACSRVRRERPDLTVPPQDLNGMSRPLWAEVSASALRTNYELLRKQASRYEAEIICVVKANAYGHGDADCTGVLLDAGADWFAVTSVDEAAQLLFRLHQQGTPIDLAGRRILALSGVFSRKDAAAAIRHQVTPVLLSLSQVQWIADAADREASPAEKYAVHLEIDTGMARHGVRWDDCPQLEAIASILSSNAHLQIEAALTHFSSPEDPSSPQTRQQIQRLTGALAYLAARGVVPPVIHVGNSVTVFEASQVEALAELAHSRGAKLKLRPGLALYGYGVVGAGLRPVLAWKTRVTSLRTLRAGDAVSYNATCHTMRTAVVATLAVGYADGYSRLLSSKGSVLVRGQRAAVLGRVTMDQIMIDVTDVEEVAVNDEVVLLGTQGEHSISAQQLATLTGTIPYEVLCGLGCRVERRLVD